MLTLLQSGQKVVIVLRYSKKFPEEKALDGRLCAVNAARVVLGRGEPFGLVSKAVEKLDSKDLMEKIVAINLAGEPFYPDVEDILKLPLFQSSLRYTPGGDLSRSPEKSLKSLLTLLREKGRKGTDRFKCTPVAALISKYLDPVSYVAREWDAICVFYLPSVLREPGPAIGIKEIFVIFDAHHPFPGRGGVASFTLFSDLSGALAYILGLPFFIRGHVGGREEFGFDPFPVTILTPVEEVWPEDVGSLDVFFGANDDMLAEYRANMELCKLRGEYSFVRGGYDALRAEQSRNVSALRRAVEQEVEVKKLQDRVREAMEMNEEVNEEVRSARREIEAVRRERDELLLNQDANTSGMMGNKRVKSDAQRVCV